MRWFVVAAGLATAAEVGAAPTIEVTCEEPERGQIEQALALELATVADDSAIKGIEITCEPGKIALRVVSLTERVERRVDATAPEPARLAALVVTEMLATLLRSEQGRPSEPAPGAAEVVVPHTSTSLPRWRGAITGSMRFFVSEAWETAGAGLLVERSLAGRLAATLGVDLARRRAVVLAEGSVDVMLLSFGLGPSVRLGSRQRAVTFGGGFRGGLASLQGNAPAGSSGHEVSGAWFGPEASARGWVTLGPLVASLGAELGVVARPVRAIADDDGVAIDGAWLTVTLGLGGQL